LIDRIAFDQMLFEDPGGPYSKAGPILRFYAVAHGNDHIQIVIRHSISLTVSGSCCIFCNNCFPLQLAFLEDILDMPRDNRFIALKKAYHLV
jgi:hypothetical protein